ncbi:3-hydroxyanthranilate 3,4-dioxygenase [Colwellia hornerae]|uniref:3-hydroxyanthranilate 3,4-dioxygenase n=2 Tax=Colwellia hornerae TaxID=89402 RepID=A0A5C6QQF3_9GAMM|nr:3-hydroxyanthranilate 3,4-dioxygenase [Colwellia hornerae]TWX62002.1 3-hydroxyanthranilate 3,4-dioxygenase [Colwellia hornerae]TWX71335.1 3-hydroxyanthranilate 3,4-dioxygenase [Colwellia hornerae]
MPFNLHAWIDEHRHLLKPPVCNKQIFEQDNFIVMIVGGPNNRTDYHYNETPELFYQLEGEMVLSVIDACVANDEQHNPENFHDITIKAGEIFLLPPKMLHSPQRFENSVGLVVEQKRENKQEDALFWFCPACKNQLYSEAFRLDNIETDLPKVFNRFYQTPTNCTCQQCGTVVTKG